MALRVLLVGDVLARAGLVVLLARCGDLVAAGRCSRDDTAGVGEDADVVLWDAGAVMGSTPAGSRTEIGRSSP